MSTFFNYYIIFFVSANVLLVSFLLYTYRRKRKVEKEVLDHGIPGITEYDKPLPLWWLYMSYVLIFVACSYLFFYPGYGSNKGYLNWTSVNEWEKEVSSVQKEYEPFMSKLSNNSVLELSKDKSALVVGHRIFLNNCSSCHGYDARGAVGFPNLTIDFWRWGGSPNDIVKSITNGRKANMPGFLGTLSKEDITAVSNYVVSLSGLGVYDSTNIALGEEKYNKICANCHSVDGKGNKNLGAPNLTRGVLMYGNGLESIKETIENGRRGVMPAHKDVLSKDQIKLLSAYVYSLK